MAKDKLQKRKEALALQLESLRLRIKDWCVYMSYPARERDEETQSVYESNLVKSAYAAHCNMHGNYLDYRFYKEVPEHIRYMNQRVDPYEYALHGKLYSIAEMKEKIDATSHMSLYKIAYGTLSDKRKE